MFPQKQAVASDADLIVIGKHNRPGLEEWFLGSLTEGVLSHLDRDLLQVTERTV